MAQLKRAFKFFDDLDIKLPVLFLGTEQHELPFKKEREWIQIAHQSGGLSCNQIYLTGTVLKVSDETRGRMVKVCNRWYESCVMREWTTLEELFEYRSTLRNILGVDCLYSYRDFEEAVYPIDATPEHIYRLAEEYIPEELDTLVDFDEDGFDRFLGFVGRWKLFILGENCD